MRDWITGERRPEPPEDPSGRLIGTILVLLILAVGLTVVLMGKL